MLSGLGLLGLLSARGLLCLFRKKFKKKKNKIKGGYLEIPVHDSILVAVVDALEDLLDAVRRVRLAVELARHNVLEQLAARHPGTHQPINQLVDCNHRSSGSNVSNQILIDNRPLVIQWRLHKGACLTLHGGLTKGDGMTLHDGLTKHGGLTKGDELTKHGKLTKGDGMTKHGGLTKGDGLTLHGGLTKGDGMTKGDGLTKQGGLTKGAGLMNLQVEDEVVETLLLYAVMQAHCNKQTTTYS